MTVSQAEIEQEASVFCRCLVNASPTPAMMRLYREAVQRQQRETASSEADERLLRYAVRHPGAVAYLDGALALLRPQALLRRRLLIMFAITEATPTYAEKYLPAKKGYWYVIVIGLIGVRAILRACIGLGWLLAAKSER